MFWIFGISLIWSILFNPILPSCFNFISILNNALVLNNKLEYLSTKQSFNLIWTVFVLFMYNFVISGELVGFTVPEWMIEKMKTYIENAKTNPDTTDEELLRIAEEYAEMEEEGRKIRREEISLEEELKRGRMRREDEMSLDRLICETDSGQNVDQLLNDIKHETVDDDLQNLDPGFLQV